jgi:Kef-type K+ transport system membrane component KefB
MPLGTELIANFAVIMIVAGVVTFVFYWLKQPLVLGYLIAGIIIGPYTPPFSLISRMMFLIRLPILAWCFCYSVLVLSFLFPNF